MIKTLNDMYQIVNLSIKNKINLIRRITIFFYYLNSMKTVIGIYNHIYKMEYTYIYLYVHSKKYF